MAERQATGTPIRELFAESDKAMSDRIAALELAVAQLTAQNTRLFLLLGTMAQTSLMQGERIGRLEQMRNGDLRLSDVLSGIEERLGRIELGAEMP